MISWNGCISCESMKCSNFSQMLNIKHFAAIKTWNTRPLRVWIIPFIHFNGHRASMMGIAIRVQTQQNLECRPLDIRLKAGNHGHTVCESQRAQCDGLWIFENHSICRRLGLDDIRSFAQFHDTFVHVQFHPGSNHKGHFILFRVTPTE